VRLSWRCFYRLTLSRQTGEFTFHDRLVLRLTAMILVSVSWLFQGTQTGGQQHNVDYKLFILLSSRCRGIATGSRAGSWVKSRDEVPPLM